MNKNCFRLIFSKTIGCLIPVAEICTAQRKPGQTRGASATSTHRWALKALPLALLGILPQAFAQIAIAPNQQQGMSQSSNGVPVMEIADPNGKGLSHNRVNDFNVTKPGLIFNNSMRDGKSQIGGLVIHNPNLRNEATAILTEVTGSGVSSLSGTLEVFGGRADLFIVNPNGLYLNGVMTLNSNGLITSTGRFGTSADPLGLTVGESSGRIIIGAEGVNTEGLSYFEVVARGIDINGEVGSASAQTDIGLIAGLNTYNLENRRHYVQATSAANTPQVAISGSAAGAMHGRFITLRSTESGAGVRHDGQIHSAKDILISSNGDVVLDEMHSNFDVTLEAADISIKSVEAGNDAMLKSSSNIAVNRLTTGRNGILLSKDSITLGASEPGDGARIAGSLDLHADKNVRINNDIQTDMLNVKAQRLLIDNAVVHATGKQATSTTKAVIIDVDDFTLAGEMELFDESGLNLLPIENGLIGSIGSPSVVDDSGFSDKFVLKQTAALLSDGGIEISANRFNNKEGLIKDSSTLGINISAAKLTNQGVVQTAGDIALTADVLANLCFSGAQVAGGEQLLCGGLSAGGDATIKAGLLRNEGGLGAQGSLALELGAGEHTNGTRAGIVGKESLRITSMGGQESSLTSEGAIKSDKDLHITLDALTSTGDGELASGGAMSLDLQKTFDNAGLIQAGTLTAYAKNIFNREGAEILVSGDTKFSAKNSIRNEINTEFASLGDLEFTAGKDIWTAADITAGGDNTILQAGGNLTNAAGTVFAGQNLTLISGGTLTNENGALISVDETLTMTSAEDINNLTGSMILSGNRFIISAGGTLTNSDESIIDGYDVTITAAKVVNSGESTISAVDSLNLTVSGDIQNESDSLITSEVVNLSAKGAIVNDNALITGDTLNIAGGTVTNSNKAEIDGKNINITADGKFLSEGGATTKGELVTIDAKQFDAQNSFVLASEDLDISTEEIKNTATVHSKKTTTVNMKNGASMVIDAGAKSPTADVLLTLNTQDLQVNGSLSNPGSVQINAAGNVRNDGDILSGGSLSIDAKGSIDNLAKRLIWAKNAIVLEAGTAINNLRDGMIRTSENLTLAANTVINDVGRIEGGGDIKIDAALLENRSEVTGDITLKEVNGDKGIVKTDNWYTEDYGLFETAYFQTTFWTPRYSADELVVKQGIIKAGGNLFINQGSGKVGIPLIRNLGGQILAGKNMSIFGDLENFGAAKHVSLIDMLKKADAFAQWTVSSAIVGNDPALRTNLFDLFDQNLLAADKSAVSIQGYDKWMYSLRKTSTPEGNALLSAIFGADWKNLKHATMRERWVAFKSVPDQTMDFYGDKQAEMSAGGTLLHTGGSLKNGIGVEWEENRTIDVQIGDEKLTTVAGEFDALFNRDSAFDFKGNYLEDLRNAINSLDTLEELIKDNPLFTANLLPDFSLINTSVTIDPVTGQARPAYQGIYPLYTTRVSYDTDAFFGSEYLFGKIGYDPSLTVTVLGDAYFDNELIVRSIEQSVGNFFAVNKGLSGPTLVQRLLDNAAVEAAKQGFVLGQPLTQEQYENLESDIVWYEPQVVDGQTVLAPKLYVSKSTLDARKKDQNSGGMITAENIFVDATSVDNINGVMRSKNDTVIYSETDVNNVSQGGTDTGIYSGDRGRLTVAAEGQVLNQGGNLQGFEQNVVGGTGVTSTATTGFNEKGNLEVRNNGILGGGQTAAGVEQKRDALGKEQQAQAAAAAEAALAAAEKGPLDPAGANPPPPAAPHVAAAAKPKLEVPKPDVRAIFEEVMQQSQAGKVADDAVSSLKVASGGNINLIGAQTAADRVELQAVGDVNMEDIAEVSSDFTSSTKHGFLSVQTTRETFGNASSHGNQLNANELTITAGGNWNVTGSDVNALSSEVEIGGNVTVAAGKELANYEKVQKTMQVVADVTAGAVGYEGKVGLSSFDTQQGPTGGKNPSFSDKDLNENGGDVSGANKNRGDTNGVRARVGLEIVETNEVIQDKVYTNSQLNLGSGSMNVRGTLDIGGADINANAQLTAEQRETMSAQEIEDKRNSMPTLDITAADIKTTKFEDTHKHTFEREETFIGATAEIHSSLLDVSANIQKTIEKADEGMEIDPALTAAAQAGNVTQAVFGDTLGASWSAGVKNTKTSTETESKSENINQIGGNISLTTTKGDIDLNGVNIAGGSVALDSAGNINQRAAESSSTSKSETKIHNVGYTEAISVGPMGAGAGASIGADGNYDKTKESSQTFTNGMISGTEVSIKAKGDHNLEGANIEAGHLDYHIDGNQNITSKQDVHNMEHERGSWSASVGVALTTNGIIQPTGSFSASGGKDYDDSRLTAEQSGISSGSMDFYVGGNQTLTGAHILNSSGQGSYRVEGTTTAAALDDFRNKDGGYGGGGAGVSKTGVPSVTIQAGRVDQVKYNATQNSTVDLGGMEMSVGGGVVGQLNRDGNNLTNVTQDRKIAGTDIKIELSLPTYNKQKKKNKVEPQRTLADTGSADAPSRPTSAASADVDVPNAPSRPTSTASADVDLPNVPSRPTNVASADVRVPTATRPASTDVDAPDASSKQPVSTASADVAVNVPSKKPAGQGGNDLARHVTSQQVGTQLKNALAKLNAADNATVNSLKTAPVTVKVMDASGKTVDIKVTDASSLQQLHGMRVVTGEQAVGIKPEGSQHGKSSETFINITNVSPGKFIYNFTSREPAPLKK